MINLPYVALASGLARVSVSGMTTANFRQQLIAG
jgi:hypothetical protein